MIGRIRFQRAAIVLPALLLIMAGMSSCSENEDVNDVPVPSAEGMMSPHEPTLLRGCRRFNRRWR